MLLSALLVLCALQGQDLEKEAAILQRKESLAKAETEKDQSKKARLLIDAAECLLKLGKEREAFVELDQISKKFSSLDYGDIAADAILMKAKAIAANPKRWAEAEAVYTTVWKTIKGSYGDKGAQAAAAVAKHYEEAGQIEKSLPFREIIIDCGGSYGGPAGDTCLWFADYYIGKGDKVKAMFYLQKVVKQYHGAYGGCKVKAEAKIEELKAGK